MRKVMERAGWARCGPWLDWAAGWRMCQVEEWPAPEHSAFRNAGIRLLPLEDAIGWRMLISNATLVDGRRIDIRIRDGRVEEIGFCGLATAEGEQCLDARGGLLLPGLHDHHVHVSATAVALASIRCHPQATGNKASLADLLRGASGNGWLRVIGYHEGGEKIIDRDWLDDVLPDRPVRVQHRTGRLWLFNSMGIDRLRATGHPLPPGLDTETGSLFDDDGWLRDALGSSPPDYRVVGAQWAQWGVTGLTDMNPQNDARAAEHFMAEQSRGALPQSVMVAGLPELSGFSFKGCLGLGAVKIHLHEASLPDLDLFIADIGRAHAEGRQIAVHCVTETELVFTLCAFRQAGTIEGDRCPSSEHLAQLAA